MQLFPNQLRQTFPALGLRCSLAILALGSLAATGAAQTTGSVKSEQKISALSGGFAGSLDDGDRFGSGVGVVGDIDGDGIDDLAIGAGDDDDGFNDAGAVWILFMNQDGTVKGDQKISATQGNFNGNLQTDAGLGGSVSRLGDFDGDGVPDVLVGSAGFDDGGANNGSVWILLLNTDGTVKSQQRIGNSAGSLGCFLATNTWFGAATDTLGDLDGDGVTDIVVGGLDDESGNDEGAVWILFLAPDSTVKNCQKISDFHGGFTGTLDTSDAFGRAAACVGDLDDDGVVDIAVGARGDDDGGPDQGAIWILFLNSNGTVKSHNKISTVGGGFTGALSNGDNLGHAMVALGDFDGDGLGSLAVASKDNATAGEGEVWILSLNSDGSVNTHVSIGAAGKGGFTGVIGNAGFGRNLGAFPDLDGDGVPDLVAGEDLDNDGGTQKGSVWILNLNGSPVVPYGCGMNPAGSLAVLSGDPMVGTVLTLSADNPLAAQAPTSPALSFLGVALSPAPLTPCGPQIPGFGMAGGGAAGELLISVSPPGFLFAQPGTPWYGPGTPSAFVLSFPPDPQLVGVSLYTQGTIVDPSPGAPVPIGLTDALQLTIGQ